MADARASIAARWPEREAQIEQLAELMGEPLELKRPIIICGASGTGKSSILRALLAAARAPSGAVDLTLCPTVRAATAEMLEQLLPHARATRAAAVSRARAAERAPAERAATEAAAAEAAAAVRRPALHGDGVDSLCAFLSEHFGGGEELRAPAPTSAARARGVALGAGDGGDEGDARLAAPRPEPLRPPTTYLLYERAERLADPSAPFLGWNPERGAAHAGSGLAGALLCLRELAGNANVCPVLVCSGQWARHVQLCAGTAPLTVRFPQYTPAQLEAVLLARTFPGVPKDARAGGRFEREWAAFSRLFVAAASAQSTDLPTLLARAPPVFERFVAPARAVDAAADGAAGARAEPVSTGAAAARTARLVSLARPLLRQLGTAVYAGDPLEGAALAAPAGAPGGGGAAAARLGGAGAKRRGRDAEADSDDESGADGPDLVPGGGGCAYATPARPVPAAAPQERGLELPLQGKQLLLAAFLASHLQPKQDASLFGANIRGAKRRRCAGPSLGPAGAAGGGAGGEGGSTRGGPAPFALERLLAIYAAMARSAGGAPAQPVGPAAMLQLASLCGLGLLARTSPAEGLDSLRFRCDAPADLVARVATNLKFPLGRYVRLDGVEP